MHTLDQPANFAFGIFRTVFCWKLDLNESLGCPLKGAALMPHGFLLLDNLAGIIFQTNVITAASGGIAENN